MSEDIRSLKSRGQRIASLVRKELSTLFKDKMSMFILFIIPLVIFITMGIGRPNVLNDVVVNVNIIDYDDTNTSHNFIVSINKTLDVTSNWDVEQYMTREEFLSQSEKLLPTNQISAYIIIPEGFEAAMIENQSTSIIVYMDSIDFISKLLTEAMLQLGMVNYQLSNLVFSAEIFYFPDMRPELDFTNLLQVSAPMIMGILLFATMNMVATQCIVGDIPLKRLLTTPIFRSEVVVGKTIAYSIVSVFQIIISMMMLEVFSVPLKGLFIDIFIILWLCSLSGIIIGVFYSAVSNTRLQAAQLFLFGFMIMMIVTSILRTPAVLRFLPLEQTQTAFSNLAFRGESLLDVGENILNLLLVNSIFFILTIIYLNRKKEFI